MALTATATATLSAEELLQRVAASGDRGAFAQLFSVYAPRLKGWLLGQGLPEAQAEEVVQDTWITVWEKAAGFDPTRARFVTWLFTIARHRRIDRFRATKRQILPDFGDADMLFDLPEPHLEDQEVVGKALNALPPEQHHLIYDLFYNGKTHLEIAAEQDLPLGTVKSRARLAMDKLRQMAGTLGSWLVFILTVVS